MKTNRLLPHQFAPGSTLDGTRIEQALQALVALYNDVPPALVLRRWSQSSMVWGLSPSLSTYHSDYQWLDGINDANYAPSNLEIPTSYTNKERAKSTNIQPLTDWLAGPVVLFANTMEVTFATSTPIIIGNFAVLAEVDAAMPYGYTNPWEYGVAPPTGKNPGDPSDDFTLQVCVSDGWDIENRRKLRQESLVYNMRSDAFRFDPSGVGAVDTIQPAHPFGVFDGFAVMAGPLILVPAGARVVMQWSLPRYDTSTASGWGLTPAKNNAWSLCAQVWRPTL